MSQPLCLGFLQWLCWSSRTLRDIKRKDRVAGDYATHNLCLTFVWLCIPCAWPREANSRSIWKFLLSLSPFAQNCLPIHEGRPLQPLATPSALMGWTVHSAYLLKLDHHRATIVHRKYNVNGVRRDSDCCVRHWEQNSEHKQWSWGLVVNTVLNQMLNYSWDMCPEGVAVYSTVWSMIGPLGVDHWPKLSKIFLYICIRRFC